MSLLIKNWSEADWKELLKWAKIGANNAMIGEFAEVEEIPPHGRLIDADTLTDKLKTYLEWDNTLYVQTCIDESPTIIPAEEGQ